MLGHAGFGGTEAYETLWLKPAALFHSVISNHAFLDSNKRAAVLAAIAMLNLNGHELVAEDCDLVDLALDTIDLQKIAEFFESHTESITYPEL